MSLILLASAWMMLLVVKYLAQKQSTKGVYKMTKEIKNYNDTLVVYQEDRMYSVVLAKNTIFIGSKGFALAVFAIELPKLRGRV